MYSKNTESATTSTKTKIKTSSDIPALKKAHKADPYALLSKYGQMAGEIYSPESYNKLKPEVRQKFDSLFYDRVVTKLNKKIGQPPISREMWDILLPGGKAAYIQGLKVNPASTLAPHEQQTVFGSRLSGEDKISAAEPHIAKRAEWTFAKTDQYLMWRLHKGVVETGTGVLQTLTGIAKDFINPASMQMMPGASLVDRHYKQSPEGAAREQKVDSYLDHLTHLFDDEQKLVDEEYGAKYAPYLENEVPVDFSQGLLKGAWGGLVNNHVATKFAGGVVGMLPQILLLRKVGSNQLLGEINKVKEGFELTGEIAKAGGISEYITSDAKLAPMARTMLRTVKGAYDGYVWGLTEGNKQSGAYAAFGAALEGGIPAAAGLIGGISDIEHKFFPDIVGKKEFFDSFNTLKTATATAYNKMAVVFGPGYLKSAVLSGFYGVPREFVGMYLSKDPMIEPLNELNAKVRNDFTKAYYGKPLYQFLTQKEKREVNKEIVKTMQTGFKYPAVFDTQASVKAVDASLKETAVLDPAREKSALLLEAVNKEQKGAPAEMVAKKEAEEVKTAAKKAKAKATQDKPEPKTKIIAKVRKVDPNEVDALVTNRRGLGPGAASLYDKSFEDTTFGKVLSQRAFFEDAHDNLAVDYWKAKNGHAPDKATATKWINAYLDSIPDDVDVDEYIAGHISGIIEHTHKAHELGYLARFGGMQEPGKVGHIYRSGNYMTDELRRKFGKPKTQWQQELDDEYSALMRKRRNSGPIKGVQPASQKITYADPSWEAKQKRIEELSAITQKYKDRYQAAVDKTKDGYVKVLNALDVLNSDRPKEEREAARAIADKWWDDNYPKWDDYYKGSEYVAARNELYNLEGSTKKIAEFRVDAKGNKVVWMNKAAMSILRTAYNPMAVFMTLHGISIPKNEIPKFIARIDFWAKNQPAFLRDAIKQALIEAEKVAGPEGVNVIGMRGEGITSAKLTYREELNHAWQRVMGGGDTYHHLDKPQFDKLYADIPPGMRRYLTDKEYNNTAENFVIEAAAKYMAGGLDKYADDPNVIAGWLDQYFTAVTEKHGAESLNLITRAVGVADLVRKWKYEDATRNPERAAEGFLRNVDEGRKRGTSEVASEAKPVFGKPVKRPKDRIVSTGGQ